MLTYHGEQGLKPRLVQDMRRDEAAGTMRPGNYKVCFIGCLGGKHEANHHNWPKEFGLREWVACYAEMFFETCSAEYRKDFCSRFLEAIPVGVELDDSLAYCAGAEHSTNEVCRFGGIVRSLGIVLGFYGWLSAKQTDAMADRFLQLMRCQGPSGSVPDTSPVLDEHSLAAVH